MLRRVGPRSTGDVRLDSSSIRQIGTPKNREVARQNSTGRLLERLRICFQCCPHTQFALIREFTERTRSGLISCFDPEKQPQGELGTGAIGQSRSIGCSRSREWTNLDVERLVVNIQCDADVSDLIPEQHTAVEVVRGGLQDRKATVLEPGEHRLGYPNEVGAWRTPSM